MWKLTIGIDTISSIPLGESQAYLLEFADDCMLLEQVLEESSGDLEQTCTDPTQDMQSQSLELGTQLSLGLELVPESIYYSRWE